MDIVEFIEARIHTYIPVLESLIARADAEQRVRDQRMLIISLEKFRADLKILEFHKQWPMRVETKPNFDLKLDDSIVGTYTYRVTQQIAWLTDQEYRKRFGELPPTTPIVRAMATVYKDHPDFQEEWLV